MKSPSPDAAPAVVAEVHSPKWRRWPLLFVAAALAAWMAAACADEETASASYELGQGWQVPGTGLKLGGYASLVVQKLEGAGPGFSAEDLSLLLSWESAGRLRLFGEFDLQNAVNWPSGQGFGTSDAYLAVERLYADYALAESVSLRLGKFLTPIGRWNVLHAAPLVWTTSRPLITERTFPTNATGVMAFGTLPVAGREVDYSVYTALGDEIRPQPQLDPFEEAYGAHLAVPLGDEVQVGVSWANFEQESDIEDRRNLVGADLLWTRNRYELSAEAAWRFSNQSSDRDEKGLYVQGVMPVSERWYAIGRYEWFDPAGPAPSLSRWLGGVACRFTPTTVLKLEWSSAVHDRIGVEEGFQASFAVLF